MSQTARLLRELIALPSVNPAFVARGGTPAVATLSRDKSARQALSLHPHAGEQRVADFIAVTAARSGLDIEFQEALPGRSNVLARLQPSGKIRRRILLAPHLDTVSVANESQFSPRVKAGRVYGRGACDTKGSAAAMLVALCELARSKERPRETEIVFAGLVDEENAQAGSRALVAGKFGGVARSSAVRRTPDAVERTGRLKAGLQTVDLAIVGEPTQLQVVTAHKGSVWLELETRGKAAHGSTPQLGRNAVEEMARIVDLLQTDYAARLKRQRHPLLGHPTVNVGVICGGSQPNIVPDHCTITLDRRTLPGETETDVRREIIRELRSRNLRAVIKNGNRIPCVPFETDATLPLVRDFIRAMGQRKPLGVHFFCDAAVLSAGGIPSVVFGPGNIAYAHTADEWISLLQLERAKDLLVRFLKSQP